MKIKLSRQEVLYLGGLFRQAERSLHYALSSPNALDGFLTYYRGTRRDRLVEFIGELRATLPPGLAPCPLPATGMLRASLRLVQNQFRSGWRFSPGEIAAFVVALEDVAKWIDSGRFTGVDDLVEIRHRCFECYYFLGSRLIGIPEWKKVESVEHFGQSTHVVPTPLDRIAGPNIRRKVA